MTQAETRDPNRTYREVQTYTTLWIVLGLTVALLLPLVLGKHSGSSLWTAALLGLSTLGGLILLGRLVVTVDDEAVRWQFGYIGWPAWQERLVELSHTENTRGTRFGSGIKGSVKHREYHVHLHSPAVRLHRHDGRTVLLGSAQPERLKAFIDARLDRPGGDEPAR